MSVWTVVSGLRSCICYRRARSHNRAVPPAQLSLTAPVRSVIACLTFLKWVQSISVHADIHLIGNMSHCFRSLFPKQCFLIYFFLLFRSLCCCRPALFLSLFTCSRYKDPSEQFADWWSIIHWHFSMKGLGKWSNWVLWQSVFPLFFTV